MPDSLSYCFGDSAYVEIKAPLENNAIISWSTPQGIIINTRKVSAIKPGKYFVKVSSTQFSATVFDSTFVRVFYRVKALARDTQICKGKSVVLDAKYPTLRLQWSTGETTQKIAVKNAGKYWVKLINGSCTTVDSIHVKPVAGSGAVLNNEHIFCLNDENKTLTVKVNPGTKIIWSTGATSATTQISKAGIYWVKTEANNCGIETDSTRVKLKVCECEMIIPNSFTPNEDNRNDFFFPVLQCEYTFFYITITDRWGYTVFISNSTQGKWDGRFKGNLCPEDNYLYKIESTEKGSDRRQVRQGQISLFR